MKSIVKTPATIREVRYVLKPAFDRFAFQKGKAGANSLCKAWSTAVSKNKRAQQETPTLRNHYCP